MNREQRRAARRNGADAAAIAYAESYRCPDCDSDAELTRDDLGIWQLWVHHDDTCPTYRKAIR